MRDNRNTKKAKVTTEKFIAKLQEKFAGNISQLNALKGTQHCSMQVLLLLSSVPAYALEFQRIILEANILV